MAKQKIEWFWKSEILVALNNDKKHTCSSPDYDLYEIKEISSRTESLGFGKRLDPTIVRYKAVLKSSDEVRCVFIA